MENADIRFTLKPIETDQDIQMAFALVSEIWPVCYAGIMSADQIQYMLARMYAPETIKTETAKGTQFFFIEVNNRPVGVLSYDSKPKDSHVVMLHKIYLLPAYWGKGLGHQILMKVAERAAAVGADAIELRVNRYNERAIRAYKRVGFFEKTTLVTDIGGGFVMDDYIMRKELK